MWFMQYIIRNHAPCCFSCVVKKWPLLTQYSLKSTCCQNSFVGAITLYRSLVSKFMIKYCTLKDLSGWNVWVSTEFCFHSFFHKFFLDLTPIFDNMLNNKDFNASSLALWAVSLKPYWPLVFELRTSSQITPLAWNPFAFEVLNLWTFRLRDAS